MDPGQGRDPGLTLTFLAGVQNLTPSIPTAGLVETTRGWSSAGELFHALAAVNEPEREWTPRDVERRAHRVLAQSLLPELVRWPSSADAWLDALPAESLRQREIAAAPTAGTSWRDTARLGWPPRTFRGRHRLRIADTLLVSTLRWTLDRLAPVVDDASLVLPGLLADVRGQLDATGELREAPAVEQASAIEPSRADLTAVASEGYPWNVMAPVADALLDFSGTGALDAIDALVVPDDVLTGRLFHLGVLGELLLAMRAAGARVTPKRPLSAAASPGPSYEIVDAKGDDWELWFEAAGVWSYRGVKSPYRLVSGGVAAAGGTLGADLMLVQASTACLLIECKYSANPARVARDGYHQAAAYALEARELIDDVTSVVVGPVEAVQTAATVKTGTATLGICNPNALPDLLAGIGFA